MKLEYRVEAINNGYLVSGPFWRKVNYYPTIEEANAQIAEWIQQDKAQMSEFSGRREE